MASWRRSLTSLYAAVLAAALLAGAAFGFAVSDMRAGSASPTSHRAAATTPPGFTKVVFLSHLNDPARTPGFPGDPRYATEVAFTVPRDGFYLQYVHEGEHTGTHWGAPCHFHVEAVCAGQLTPEDLVLPAVVIDIRAERRANVDYRATVADLEAWVATYGAMPEGAAVILWTGCDRWWGPDASPTHRTYYNCGTGERGFHQPGFSLNAVRWLIEQGVLGDRGALGTDTFGPDPGTDARFRESSLVFHRHRIDLENLTNLGALPPTGAWIVVGGPRNLRGSGSPATIFGLLP
jgi:kynurenine formamidase